MACAEDGGLTATVDLAVGDQTWTIETSPGPSLLADYGKKGAWFALWLGLALTALLCGYAFMLRRRSLQTQEFAVASQAAKESLDTGRVAERPIVHKPFARDVLVAAVEKALFAQR